MAEGSWRFVETCSSWPSPLTVIVIVAFKSLGGPDLGLEGKASTPLLHGSLDSFGSSQYLFFVALGTNLLSSCEIPRTWTRVCLTLKTSVSRTASGWARNSKLTESIPKVLNFVLRKLQVSASRVRETVLCNGFPAQICICTEANQRG